MPTSISPDVHTLGHLGVATLAGLAVGIEREWSGHATGPRARFAGIRTFTLLGIACGLMGWFWMAGLEGPSVVMLAGLSALIVVAYLAASRRGVDGTTEVAAFVVMAAGVLAGTGPDRLASGITALTVLLLLEKKQLHGLVSKMDLVELRGGARFAVMAAVIFPLLPSGSYGPWGGVQPRLLWALVLMFSGISFLGYVARRMSRGDSGYAMVGALGGAVSSTSATLALSRVSRHETTAGRALASGAIGASVMMYPRVLIAAAVLAMPLAKAVWPALVVQVLIGGGLFLRGIREGRGDSAAKRRIGTEQNPLDFFTALQMAVVFQLVMYGVWFSRQHLGHAGVYGSAALSGLVDVDATTVSMAHLIASGTAADVAARGLLAGILANTLVKLAIAIFIGRGRFRPLTAAGLAAMAIALGAAIYWT